MPRLPVSAIQARQRYVRAGGHNLLQEGSREAGTYGWVSAGPVTWGDWPGDERPAWYLGRDEFDGEAIGPNGPWREPGQSILAAVTRCTEVIVGTIVGTHWRYLVGDRSEAHPLWVTDPMLLGSTPGPYGSSVAAGQRLDAHSFWSTWVTHALWWGLGAFVCALDADGQPLAGTMRLVNPYLVGVSADGHYVLDPRGETPIRTSFDGRFIVGGRTWRLVVLRGMPPNDGHAPEGVLTRHWATLRLGASVSEYVAGTFANGVPAGFLKVSTPGFKQGDAETLKADWMRAHGGSKRSIAVLSATVDFQPISLSPVDAEAQAMARHVRTEVAHAFNLSAVWLDEGASGLTYQNATDRRRDLVDVSLSGWGARLAATLSAVLPYGHSLDVDWAAFYRPSIETLMPAMVAAVGAGILSGTEARQVLGLVPGTLPDPKWTDRSKAVTKPQPLPPALAANAGIKPTTEEDPE